MKCKDCNSILCSYRTSDAEKDCFYERHPDYPMPRDLKTWNDIVAYVLKEHNGIGNYLDDPDVRDTAKKLQKKYKFDCANEEWDIVYRRGLDAGINYGKTEALRVQASVEWGEEDESMYIRTLGILGKCHIGELPTKVEEELNWLKSLKDRYIWKPSEEQMKVLRYLDKGTPLNDFDKRVLHVLIGQLKKLREE